MKIIFVTMEITLFLNMIPSSQVNTISYQSHVLLFCVASFIFAKLDYLRELVDKMVNIPGQEIISISAS